VNGARPTRRKSELEDDDQDLPTREDFAKARDENDPDAVAERWDGSAYRDPGSLTWVGPDE
jgi:hypothetical protein